MQIQIRFVGAVALVFALSISLATSVAHASRRNPPRVVLGGQLMTFQADASLGVANVNDGRVDIDVTGRTARLVLKTPSGQTFAVQGPVVSITRDTCGSIIYTAARTGRDAQTLVIRDNSDSRCSNGVETEVILRRQIGTAQPTVSQFKAERLSRQQPNFIIDGE